MSAFDSNTSTASPFKIFRQYTMSDIDSWNFYNGRCPNYALEWSDCTNEEYWGKDYDYIVGNKKELTTEGLEDGYSSYLHGMKEQYKKYVNKNMDICCRFEDVLCRWDGDAGVVFTSGGVELWEAIRNYSPCILISCGETCVRGSKQQENWDGQGEADIIRKKIEFCEKMFPEHSSILLDMDEDVCQVLFNENVDESVIKMKDVRNGKRVMIEHPVFHDATYGVYNSVVRDTYKKDTILYLNNRETFRALRMKGVEIFWAV